MLPLGPTGMGDSPYQSFSAFAGNALLIDLEALAKDGWIERCELHGRFSQARVNYPRVTAFKLKRLRRVAERFLASASARDRRAFQAFCRKQRSWLDDYALFIALKEHYSGKPWFRWPVDLRLRKRTALRGAMDRFSYEVRVQQFIQYVFHRQWSALKVYANGKGISIVGDVALYVAHDSTDVWANRDLFLLDRRGRPLKMTGVPPDYFSRNGQLWGHPVYNWRCHRATGFAWWVARMRANLELCDILRIDHFRGLLSFWAVPYGKRTARNGKWMPAPGAALLAALKRRLGSLPLIAEDLGVITPDVVELRDRYALPGMKILQYAFGSGPCNAYLPHAFTDRDVVYTGTHDNDTMAGWWRRASAEEKRYARGYLGEKHPATWSFIRLAWSSPACWAIVPLQDVLDIGSAARMNRPGTGAGNWRWRFEDGCLAPCLAARLRRLTETYGRTLTR